MQTWCSETPLGKLPDCYMVSTGSLPTSGWSRLLSLWSWCGVDLDGKEQIDLAPCAVLFSWTYSLDQTTPIYNKPVGQSPLIVSVYSAGEMNQFKKDQIILSASSFGSCSWMSSLALRIESRAVTMGRGLGVQKREKALTERREKGKEKEGRKREREKEKEKRKREKVKCLHCIGRSLWGKGKPGGPGLESSRFGIKFRVCQGLKDAGRTWKPGQLWYEICISVPCPGLKPNILAFC